SFLPSDVRSLLERTTNRSLPRLYGTIAAELFIEKCSKHFQDKSFTNGIGLAKQVSQQKRGEESLGTVHEECKKRLWQISFDFETLKTDFYGDMPLVTEERVQESQIKVLIGNCAVGCTEASSSTAGIFGCFFALDGLGTLRSQELGCPFA